jgi:DNA mismatch endonuclease (patch repair protein)
MTDIFSKEKRSQIMSKVKNKNTTPEIIIRKLLYSLGYRYRLNKKGLPGSPDIVFISKKKAIFVHGCLWHGHNCKRAKLPDSNKEEWRNKIIVNIERDNQVFNRLNDMGWNYLVVWQCEIKKRSIEEIKEKLIRFIENN